MSGLGSWLRAARVEAKLELSDLASRTKIQVRHLEAVEAGNWAALPTKVHARAFAMAMAKACGIDDEEAIEHVSAELAPRPVVKPIAQDKVKEVRVGALGTAPDSGPENDLVLTAPAPRAWRRYPWKLWSIVAVSAVLFLLLLNAVVGALRPPRVAAGQGNEGAATAVTATAAADLSATAESPQVVEGEQLSLRSRRQTWVVLQIDGKRLPTILLERDKREYWRVKQKAVMLAGNIGAVRVWWRNDNLGYFGALGERMNGIVFEPGQPWRKDPTQDLALPPGVPSKAAQ